MRNFFGNLCAYQSFRPFHECEFVRQAAFQENTDTAMPERIGRRDQSHVARYLQLSVG
jgi:hypothetical protein